MSSSLLLHCASVHFLLGKEPEGFPLPPGAISSPTWSCFSSAPCPQFFFLIWGFRTSPLSLLLPQTHSLPAPFSPRFGDDIPGMEGLGTGKLCRVLLSGPALALMQTNLIMGEDSGMASVSLACLQVSGSPEKTSSASSSCHVHAYAYIHYVKERPFMYASASDYLHWAAEMLVCFLLILWLRISAA